MLRKLLLSPLVTLILLSGQLATTSQAQTVQAHPLNDDEKRQILYQLLQLRDILKLTLPEYEGRVAELQSLVEKADKACTDKVESEQAQTKAAQTERDIYIEKGKVCEAALKQATKKRSAGCIIKKIFTFGISGCH